MKILFVSSEVAPYSKTGGLGDVAGALPAALAARGHEVKVVTPLYGSIKQDVLSPTGQEVRLRFPFGEEVAHLYETYPSPRHQVLFLAHSGFYSRKGVYQENGQDYGDNHRRFAFLSVGALAAAEAIGFEADILHLNDWPTGLAAVALSRGFSDGPLRKARSVFTIHNLAYQGLFRKSVMDDLGLPWELFRASGGFEFHDAVNFMKAGLSHADALTTVSRRYAEEIQTPEFGEQLDGLLRSRRNDLHGILNGVDYGEWTPSKDRHLPHGFDAGDLSGKLLCKRVLRERMGLPLLGGDAGAPVFGVVSRLVDQKGFDILIPSLNWMLHHGMQVTALGSGDKRYEEGLRQLQRRYPHQMGVQIGFDNKLAHLIEAGSDFFLMPSRYEPCGLNQMYSLRYGSVPVVRSTGGLDDTVTDISQPGGTGVKFHEFSEPALSHAIWRALELYRDPARLYSVRLRGMQKNYSWDRSAAEYEALYRSLT